MKKIIFVLSLVFLSSCANAVPPDMNFEDVPNCGNYLIDGHLWGSPEGYNNIQSYWNQYGAAINDNGSRFVGYNCSGWYGGVEADNTPVSGENMVFTHCQRTADDGWVRTCTGSGYLAQGPRCMRATEAITVPGGAVNFSAYIAGFNKDVGEDCNQASPTSYQAFVGIRLANDSTICTPGASVTETGRACIVRTTRQENSKQGWHYDTCSLADANIQPGDSVIVEMYRRACGNYAAGNQYMFNLDSMFFVDGAGDEVIVIEPNITMIAFPLSEQIVTLSWTDYSTESSLSYEILRKEDGAASYISIANITRATNQTVTYNDTSIGLLTRYWYFIKAYNNSIQVDESNEDDALTYECYDRIDYAPYPTSTDCYSLYNTDPTMWYCSRANKCIYADIGNCRESIPADCIGVTTFSANSTYECTGINDCWCNWLDAPEPFCEQKYVLADECVEDLSCYTGYCSGYATSTGCQCGEGGESNCDAGNDELCKFGDENYRNDDTCWVEGVCSDGNFSCGTNDQCGDQFFCSNLTGTCQPNTINITAVVLGTVDISGTNDWVRANWSYASHPPYKYLLTSGLDEDYSLNDSLVSLLNGSLETHVFRLLHGYDHYVRIFAMNADSKIEAASERIRVSTVGQPCDSDNDCYGDTHCSINATCQLNFPLELSYPDERNQITFTWEHQLDVVAEWSLGSDSCYYDIYEYDNLWSWPASVELIETVDFESYFGLESYCDITNETCEHTVSRQVYNDTWYRVVLRCSASPDVNVTKSSEELVPSVGNLTLETTSAMSASTGLPVIELNWSKYDNSRSDFTMYRVIRNGTEVYRSTTIDSTNWTDDSFTDSDFGDVYNYTLQVWDCSLGLCWFLDGILDELITTTQDNGLVWQCWLTDPECAPVPSEYRYCNLSSGICESGCGNDTDCGPGELCSAGECLASGYECLEDNDCWGQSFLDRGFSCNSVGTDCYCDQYTKDAWDQGQYICKPKVDDGEPCFMDIQCETGNCTAEKSSLMDPECSDVSMWLISSPPEITQCNFISGQEGACLLDQYCYSEGACAGVDNLGCVNDSECGTHQYCTVSVENQDSGVCALDKTPIDGTEWCYRDTWCSGHNTNLSQCVGYYCIPANWTCLDDDDCAYGDTCDLTTHSCNPCIQEGHACDETDLYDVYDSSCCGGLDCMGDYLSSIGTCVPDAYECLYQSGVTSGGGADAYCSCESSNQDGICSSLGSNIANNLEWCFLEPSPSLALDFANLNHKCINKYAAGHLCDYNYQCRSSGCGLVNGVKVCLEDPTDPEVGASKCSTDTDCQGGEMCSDYSICFYSIFQEDQSSGQCMDLSSGLTSITCGGNSPDDLGCGTSGKYFCDPDDFVCIFDECSDTNDCWMPEQKYCNLDCGYCQWKLSEGEACYHNYECESEYCVNGVCDSLACTVDQDCINSSLYGYGYCCEDGICQQCSYSVEHECVNGLEMTEEGQRWLVSYWGECEFDDCSQDILDDFGSYDCVQNCEDRDNQVDISSETDSRFYWTNNGLRTNVNTDFRSSVRASVDLCSNIEDYPDVEGDAVFVSLIASDRDGRYSADDTVTYLILRDSFKVNASILDDVFQITANRPARCEYYFEKSSGIASTRISMGDWADSWSVTPSIPDTFTTSQFKIACIDYFGYTNGEFGSGPGDGEWYQCGYRFSCWIQNINITYVGGIILVFFLLLVLPEVYGMFWGRRGGEE